MDRQGGGEVFFLPVISKTVGSVAFVAELGHLEQKSFLGYFSIKHLEFFVNFRLWCL